jgi:hypothetical protein
MTQALNYTPKAIADIMAFAAQPFRSKEDKLCAEWIAEQLQRAQVFALPDGGRLLDRGKPRPQVPHDHFRPPFPVVAIEYQATPNGFEHEVYAVERSSKRIALAWEGETGKGVLVASISYYDDRGFWAPPMVAAYISYDGGYRVNDTPNDFQRALIQQGQVTPAIVKAPALQLAGWVPLLPSLFAQMVLEHGRDNALIQCSADTSPELGAYLDLCIALACTNVTTEKRTAPAQLNKRRIKAGKPPLKDFHVLQIGGEGGVGFGGGAGHDGVRSHLRRGHIRRLGPERITWVNACMVRGSKPGFVDKHYSVGAAA